MKTILRMFKKAFGFLSKITINNENLSYCMQERHSKQKKW